MCIRDRSVCVCVCVCVSVSVCVFRQVKLLFLLSLLSGLKTKSTVWDVTNICVYLEKIYVVLCPSLWPGAILSISARKGVSLSPPRRQDVSLSPSPWKCVKGGWGRVEKTHRENTQRENTERERFFTLLVLFVKNRCFKVAKTRLQDYYYYYYYFHFFF